MHFEVSFPATAIGKPVTGRAVVMISRVNDREPRLRQAACHPGLLPGRTAP